MNSVIPNKYLSAPHLLATNRLSSNLSDPHASQTMASRKRKASEEPDQDRMSLSPSPSVLNRPIASSTTHRTPKRTRTGAAQGRPLPLTRLLQTLSADDMRQLLQNISEQHPSLQQEIVTKAPRPGIDSTLHVLNDYENTFRAAMPLGSRPTSDYAYNRVRQHIHSLLEALRDFTPYYLPPQEPQPSCSLTYLDAVTNTIHRLPDWDTFAHQRSKIEAYDEIAKAWALVIREASKRAGGFHLQFGGWDQKLVQHNVKSGGKMEEAVDELKVALGLRQAGGGAGPAGTMASGTGDVSEDRMNIRQQLFAGTFGQDVGVGPGRW